MPATKRSTKEGSAKAPAKKKASKIPVIFPEVSARIKQLIANSPYTYNDLAEMSGLKLTTVMSYSSDRVTPSIYYLRFLKRVFNVSMDELIDGDKPSEMMAEAIGKLEIATKILKTIKTRV